MIHPPRVYEELGCSTSLRTLVYDSTYISIAERIAELSYDEKIKVGSIIVNEGQVVSQGWNGTPSGMANATRDASGRTLPYVIHSEANALMKLAKNGGSSKGATIYCTHSPCYNCALLILQAGIKRVVYSEVYCEDSLLFMKQRGLQVDCIRSGN